MKKALIENDVLSADYYFQICCAMQMSDTMAKHLLTETYDYFLFNIYSSINLFAVRDDLTSYFFFFPHCPFPRGEPS